VAGRLGFDVAREREDEFANFARSEPRKQRGEIQVFRADSLDGREFAVQDVINAAIRAAALNSDEVGHLLDDTNESVVAGRVSADGAEFGFGEVSATGAAANRLRGFVERRNESGEPFLFLDQEVQRNPLRRSVSEPGELLQGF